MTGSSQWQIFFPNVTIHFHSGDIHWPLLPDWWPSVLGDLNLWYEAEWHPAPAASHRVARVKSDIWFPFTPDKNLSGKCTTAIVEVGPAVYSSITPPSLTVTGRHVSYINSNCDIDLFPQSFDAKMPPVSICFTKKKAIFRISFVTLS